VEEKSPKFKKMRRLMEEGMIRLEMVDGWMVVVVGEARNFNLI
jgi:hypothetical protein